MSMIQPKPNQHEWLRSAGIIDIVSGERVLGDLQSLPLPKALWESLWQQLPQHLIALSDSLGALTTLHKLLAHRLQHQQTLDDNLGNPLEIQRLLRCFDLGSEPRQWLTSGMATVPPIAQPSSLDPQRLLRLITPEPSRSAALRQLQTWYHNQTIASALDHFWGQSSIEETLHRSSLAAKTVLNVLFQYCQQQVIKKLGQPYRDNGTEASSCILSLAELAGNEFCHNQSLTLLFIADTDGKTQATRSVSNRQYFDRLAYEFDEALRSTVNGKPLFQVQWSFDPNASQNQIVCDQHATVRRYELKGRTWQRQQFLRIQPVAGDIRTGEVFIDALQAWVYRRYVVEADISGTAVLKRKIIRQLLGRDLMRWDPSDPEQGVRLVASTIQILQLMHGYKDETLRTPSSFAAVNALEHARLLTEHQSAALYDALQKSYSNLLANQLDTNPSKEGRFHHRRQQTANAFDKAKRHTIEILMADHPREDWPAEESDLVLDPSPPRTWVSHVLRKYNLSEPQAIYDLLVDLSQEEIRYLSTRRCRQQFAEVVPKILHVVAQAPSPVSTLHSLNRITQSIGGKRVLWQLFNSNDATLRAVIKICAASPYLTSQLTQAPGMLDELLDSLLLGRLPSSKELQTAFAKWQAFSQFNDTITEFKRTFQLRIAIRDLLNKSDARDTHNALCDIADVIVSSTIAEILRPPKIGEREKAPAPRNRFALLAIDRYGQRDIGYRDPLHLLIVFEDNDKLSLNEGSQFLPQHVFDRLGQSLLQQFNHHSSGERLYEAYLRWGPMQGKTHLAISSRDLGDYLRNQQAPLDHLIQLTSLRLIAGDKKFGQEVISLIHKSYHSVTPESASNLIQPMLEQLLQDDKLQLLTLRRALFTCQQLEQLKVAPEFAEAWASADGLAPDVGPSLRRIDLASQLSRKSSETDLPRDDDAQRRLAYLMNEPNWETIEQRLQCIKRHLVQFGEQIYGTESRA